MGKFWNRNPKRGTIIQCLETKSREKNVFTDFNCYFWILFPAEWRHLRRCWISFPAVFILAAESKMSFQVNFLDHKYLIQIPFKYLLRTGSADWDGAVRGSTGSRYVGTLKWLTWHLFFWLVRSKNDDVTGIMH